MNLQEEGVRKEINRVRFKSKLKQHFPNAQEQSDMKSNFLIFPEGMQHMLRTVMKAHERDDVTAIF